MTAACNQLDAIDPYGTCGPDHVDPGRMGFRPHPCLTHGRLQPTECFDILRRQRRQRRQFPLQLCAARLETRLCVQLILQALKLLQLPESFLLVFDGVGCCHRRFVSLAAGVQLFLRMRSRCLQLRQSLSEQVQMLLIRNMGGLQSHHLLLQLVELPAVMLQQLALLLRLLQLGLLRCKGCFQLAAAPQLLLEGLALKQQLGTLLADGLKLHFSGLEAGW